MFLRRFKTLYMYHGDFCVIDFDHRNNIMTNVDDHQCVINGSNDILDQQFFSKNDSICDDSEITKILNAAELNMVQHWPDTHQLSRIVLSEFRQFHFEQNSLDMQHRAPT